MIVRGGGHPNSRVNAFRNTPLNARICAIWARSIRRHGMAWHGCHHTSHNPYSPDSRGVTNRPPAAIFSQTSFQKQNFAASGDAIPILGTLCPESRSLQFFFPHSNGIKVISKLLILTRWTIADSGQYLFILNKASLEPEPSKSLYTTRKN